MKRGQHEGINFLREMLHCIYLAEKIKNERKKKTEKSIGYGHDEIGSKSERK